MRRRLHYAIVGVIVVMCVTATIKLFDWHMVFVALTHMRWGILVGGCLPVLFAIFALRGLRWLIVLGIQPNISNFRQSFFANGAASGLAALTPFQIGEVIKVRLIPDRTDGGWRSGMSAFFVERLLDLVGMLSMGLCGIVVHLHHGILLPVAVAMPVFGGLILAVLGGHIQRLPERMQRYVQAFRYVRRIMLASLLTVPIWLFYSVLWWIAALSMNIVLNFAQVTILLGGVMIAVVVSMTPGGLGVSELGSRSIMLWLGRSLTDAETVAIAIRLITPMAIFSGGLCLLAMAISKRWSTTKSNRPPAKRVDSDAS